MAKSKALIDAENAAAHANAEKAATDKASYEAAVEAAHAKLGDEDSEGATGPVPVVKLANPSKAKEEEVEVTITKFGDGKVSTGMHVAGEGDIYAERGEKLTVSKSVAVLLERRAFAEMD